MRVTRTNEERRLHRRHGETKEEAAAYLKQWSEAHREQISEKNKAAYALDGKERYQKNKEARLRAQKKYAEAHPERVAAVSKAWREKNPEKVAFYAESNREKNTDSRLRRKYGITLAERNALLEAQGNACAVCKATTPGNKKYGWSIDHDHITGAVRGLLCHTCNLALGLLKDDVERLDAAIVYLVRSRRPKLKIVGGIE
jgi:hypothetical protein